MNWTLLVPGALLPPQLAPELARAMRAPALAHQLALARPLPPLAHGGAQPQPAATHAAHWAWLARDFGLDADALVTAPYAWRAAAARDAAGQADDDTLWIAHCEPVHLAIARDHFVVTDLGDAPLQPPEAAELLERANAVLAAAAGDGAPALRLVVRADQWFLLSPAPLALRTWSLDAVLGRSVQDRLPVDTGADGGAGGDARRWRVLGNEIQMSWHASRATAAREDAGQRPANALWLHGGGRWRPLASAPARVLRVDAGSAEDTVLRGWQQAGAAPAEAQAHADTLSICRALFGPYAHQAWESWLERLSVVEARIEAELAMARAAGAQRFDLVLCGAAQARRIELPLQAPWWRRLRANAHPPALLLQRWLTEGAAAAGAGPRAAGRALAA
jgi:hypothetical protein